MIKIRNYYQKQLPTKEMPADIILYLEKYPENINKIRESKSYLKFMNKGEI